jgi:hypothetical protein
MVEPWQVRTVKLQDHLMPQAAAAARLDDVVRLALEAVQAARPAFGKVITAKVSSRELEFGKAIEAQFYGRTSECALFGVSPHFTDVFTDRPERLAFLDAFTRLLEPKYDRQTEDYRLA